MLKFVNVVLIDGVRFTKNERLNIEFGFKAKVRSI